MKKLELAYCKECDDLVVYDVCEELFSEQFKGEQISYLFKAGRCRHCHGEVATDRDYNSRKSEVKIEAYKKQLGLVTLKEITEILEKYDIGKENLAEIAGFGKVTIKRYYDGFIPSRKYSDILLKILNDEQYFMNLVQQNKSKLKNVTLKKITDRYEKLSELSSSKLEQIVNYVITSIGEVTPLALQKLLSFSNGVNYALNGKQLINEECQAWAHGPVYPQIYNKYKRYGYKPIDDGICSTHGCMLSKLSKDELKAIDLVISTFGVYSPKTLEKISHSQDFWIEKRIGYKENQVGKEVIDEAAIKLFYTRHQLNSEETIIKYIVDCIKEW